MVLHSKLTDPMDPKILPVSYKDKLVGRDEKKVSDEKKDENDPSFDGLRGVDSFASGPLRLRSRKNASKCVHRTVVCMHMRAVCPP